MSFDPDRYTERMGLIVVRQQDQNAFVAADLVPDLLQQEFPVHVLSLEDLMEVASRFDTAGDFFFYLEERRLLVGEGVQPHVHREVDMAQTMLQLLPERLRRARPDVTDEVFEKSVEMFRRKISGELRQSDDWKRSLLVDDMIARMHDRDPHQPWNEGGKPSDSMIAAELLSNLDRARRAEIGRKCVAAARISAEGKERWGAFWHGTRFNKCVYVFVFMEGAREERLDLADKFLRYAMVHSGMDTGFVVATDPANSKGRAYDVVVRLEPPCEADRRLLEEGPDPFNVG